MLLVENVLHILQQGRNESIPSFETPDQAIMIISKDMDVQQRNLEHKSGKNWRQNLEEQRLLLKLEGIMS
jgi:hypothetical protein